MAFCRALSGVLVDLDQHRREGGSSGVLTDRLALDLAGVLWRAFWRPSISTGAKADLGVAR